MFDHSPEYEGEPKDEAERLDRAIGEVDWAVPPAGAVVSTFDAPSGPLAVMSLGDPQAPRVVLVPGATGSKEDFKLMLPVLAGAGYYAQSFDLAGQYQSAKAGPPRGRRYDFDLFVDDLVAFIERGGMASPVHLLGYSFAGMVAMLTLVRRPELVRSLTLLTTPPEPGNAFRGVKGAIGPLSHLSTPRISAALMIWGIKTNKNRAPQHRVDFVRMRFEHTNRRSVADILRLMKGAPDLRAEVAASPVPKLVAVGTRDLWPTELHADFARRIGARLAVYPGGHSPCETAPNQLSRDMLELFRDAGDAVAGERAAS